jgi:radical SAM superfamily enzyme YgiQ (UPF0313 family)
VIRALSKAGFKLLFIGMESGSKKVLKRLQKGIDISKAGEVVSLLRKYGIKFRVSFMSSTPGEKFKETLETVRLIKQLKLKKDEYYMGAGIQIYPGTADCQKFLKLHPDYRWLAKDYDFKGKYSAARDPHGNILFPRYEEYSHLTLAILFSIIGPTYFLRAAKNRLTGFFGKLKFSR